MAKLANITKKIFGFSRSGVRPYKYYHFLNTLPNNTLDQILLFSEAHLTLKNVPRLDQKRILFFNDQKHKYLLKKLMPHETDYFLSYVYDGFDGKTQKTSPKIFNTTGHLNHLPFKEGFFDLVIASFSLNSAEIDKRFIHKMSTLLKNGGRLVLTLRHMQLEHMLFNQNPSQAGSPDSHISTYYNHLKTNNLFVEDIAEGVVDKALKPFFTQEGVFDHYHDYKNVPVTLLIKAVKYVRKVTVKK